MKLFLKNYLLFILLSLLTLFSCIEKSTTDSNNPSTPPLSIDYGISEDLYIALTNTALELIQKGNFGSQSNFFVSPSLPNGLSLDITNGNISGTPTTVSLPTAYTITANAGGKNFSKTISLGVAPSRVWITNTNSDNPYQLTAYVVGDGAKQISDWTWSSSDESLATVNNGVVSFASTLTGGTVVISATKDSNTGTITFNVPVASVDYGIGGDFYMALASSNVLLEQRTDFGSQSRFSISPNLSNGLSLDITNGNISGTPTNFNLPIPYTVTATADSKTYTNIISLGVAPSQVWVTNTNSLKTYELTAFVVGDLTKQTEISWSSSDFSLATVNNNGVVGLKTSSTGGNVDVIATTADGNTGKITFNIFSAYIDYGTSNFYIALINNPIDLIQNSVLNNPIFSVNPALPSGLTLDTTNGNINGTPTAITPPSQYTVKATVDGRAQTKVISLGIAPSQIWVTNAKSVNPYQLTAYVVGNRSQQTGVSWRSSDTSLATVDNNGLVDLKISPVRGTVEITATKGSNTDKVAFNVSSTSIDYGTNDFYIALINVNILLEQETDLGSQANFSVSPTLPNGLFLNVTNGNISGTPTTVSLPTPYTVTATVGSKSYNKVISLGGAPSRVWITNTNASKPYELTAYVQGGGSQQISDWTWSSSDASLATVRDGAVSPKYTPTGGTVVISANKNGHSGSVSFVVPSTSPVYGISGDFYMALANSNVLFVQKTNFGSSTTFSVIPSLPSGLTLDANSGDIRGTPTTESVPIRYTITANAGGKNYSKRISLGVAPSEVWVINTNAANSYQLTAYVVGDGTKQISDWTWSSSDGSLATVTNGVVSFESTTTGGTVVIAASKNSYSNGVSFTVNKVKEVNGHKVVIDGEKVELVINNGTETLANSEFKNKGLTSVVIPNSVRTIGHNTFRDNPLTNVVIPNSVRTIAHNAFRNTKLTRVVIPEGVTTLGESVFAYIPTLTNVVIPGSVRAILSSAFYESGLTSVVIGNGVVSIGTAFTRNKLTSVFIPDSVTTIGVAFQGNPLGEVNLKQSLYNSLVSGSDTRQRDRVFGSQVTNYIKRP